MNKQADLFPQMQTLAEAVTPAKARDELGAVGEALWKLGEALEERFVEMPSVGHNISASDLWQVLNASLYGSKDEKHFRQVHAVALKQLQKNGVKLQSA